MSCKITSAYFCIHLAVVSLLILPHVIFSQQSKRVKKQISTRNTELEELRSTIKELRDEIERKKATEMTVLKDIEDLGKELDLTTRLVTRLKQEIGRRDATVDSARSEVFQMRRHIKKLRKRFARRVVKIYKEGSLDNLELMLTSARPSQFYHRYKYLNVINEYDRKLYHSIEEAIGKLKELEATMTAEIREREGFVRESNSHKARLAINRERRNRMLRQVRQDQRALEKVVRDKQEAALQVEELITKLEKERKRLEELARARKIPIEELVTDAEFAKYKGKLSWPAKGKVVAKFGRRRHPKLKTITENSGIDIGAKAGSDVKAVLNGRVTSITWIRGFGNTLIIDHGSGFYTVYTHLGEVYIAPDEDVLGGQVIATVGDTGSLNGSQLHFEVWRNREKLDPMKWLKKR